MNSFHKQAGSGKYRKLAVGTALAIGLIAAPLAANAQSPAVIGYLGNFDAANYEGKDANGFEVQIEGAQLGDFYPAWCGNKFGCPVVEAYATGVYVRYQSPYDPASGLFTKATVPKTPGASFAGSCYMGYPSYLAAGCDHFGVHLKYTATAARVVSYRWMFADPANPGQLVASANNIFVPAPVYTFIPPVVVGAAPVLQIEVQTPPPPPPPPAVPPQYGNATWMKVFVTELQREVALDELVDTNAIVPQDVTQVETDWVLMQPAPPIVEGNRPVRTRHVAGRALAGGTRAVIRRFENYAYTGAYNALNHEAICGGDGKCRAPLAGELGDLLNAQMAAANVAVPGVVVTVVGAGKVASSDGVIACGSKCASANGLGAVVNLTATPASNNNFNGWTGACLGVATTCAITVADIMNTTATFTPKPVVVVVGGGGGGGAGGGTPQFTLSIGRSNSGTVTSDVTGINCGSACSAKFAQGSVVVLTATPPTGKTFASWGGACAGSAPVCIVTINANVTAQANFNK